MNLCESQNLLQILISKQLYMNMPKVMREMLSIVSDSLLSHDMQQLDEALISKVVRTGSIYSSLIFIDAELYPINGQLSSSEWTNVVATPFIKSL